MCFVVSMLRYLRCILSQQVGVFHFKSSAVSSRSAHPPAAAVVRSASVFLSAGSLLAAASSLGGPPPCLQREAAAGPRNHLMDELFFYSKNGPEGP